MKIGVAFLCGLLLGALIGWQASPRAGRYELCTPAGYMMLLDTATGTTWHDSTNGGWTLFDVSPSVSR